MSFQKGVSGNANGRPKGTKNSFSRFELERAIKVVEKDKKISLYQHMVEKAFVNDAVLVALIKKLLPDAKATESIDDDSWIWDDIRIAISDDPASLERFKKYYG